MTDEAFFREQMFKHARELGANEAKQQATDSALERISADMKEGFNDVKRVNESQINALRSELLTRLDQQDKRRSGEVDDLREGFGGFRSLIVRVGIGLALWVLAMVSGQYALDLRPAADAGAAALRAAQP